MALPPSVREGARPAAPQSCGYTGGRRRGSRPERIRRRGRTPPPPGCRPSCGAAGPRGVLKKSAGLRRKGEPLQYGPKIAGVPLLHAQLLGEDERGEGIGEPVAGQDGGAQLGHAGGHQGHPRPGSPTAAEKFPRSRLEGDTVGIGVPGQRHPLVHDRLGRVAQVVVIPGEPGRSREDGVPHRVDVFRRGGEAAAAEKDVVHLHPDSVGVDEGAVQVKKKHTLDSSIQIQKRHGKSAASSA